MGSIDDKTMRGVKDKIEIISEGSREFRLKEWIEIRSKRIKRIKDKTIIKINNKRIRSIKNKTIRRRKYINDKAVRINKKTSDR